MNALTQFPATTLAAPAHPHPTPVEIETAIYRALGDANRRLWAEGHPGISVHAFKAVREGVRRANEAHG